MSQHTLRPVEMKATVSDMEPFMLVKSKPPTISFVVKVSAKIDRLIQGRAPRVRGVVNNYCIATI